MTSGRHGISEGQVGPTKYEEYAKRKGTANVTALKSAREFLPGWIDRSTLVSRARLNILRVIPQGRLPLGLGAANAHDSNAYLASLDRSSLPLRGSNRKLYS
jgi:hypothetical protein